MDTISAGLNTLKEIWQHTPGPVKTFAVAVPSALFGAWISSRGQSKRTIIDEIKALGAANAICFSIANRAMALKGQHTRSMKEAYDAATDAHDAAMTNNVGEHTVVMDFQTLLAPTFPSASLEKIIVEKTNVGVAGVACAIALIGAIEELRGSLEYRTALADDFRKDASAPLKVRIARYLGLFHNGFVDDRFRTNVDALVSHTDDCIFFSVRLSGILVRYEKKLRRRYWHMHLPVRKMAEPNWKKAREANLIPPDSEYMDWTSSFVKYPTFLERVKARLRTASHK